MVTMVLAEEVQAPEIESEIGQIKVNQWYYRVAGAGVRYYSYDECALPAEEAKPWVPDSLLARLR